MMKNNDLTSNLRAFSWRRQGFEKYEESAEEALKLTVAVYSSQPTAPLSILARTSGLDSEAFQRLEAERRAIRLPAMRGSVFLMPVETAPQVLSATRTPMNQLQSRLEYGEISAEDYVRVRKRFLEIATSPMTTEELQEEIPTQGKLMVAIRVLAYEGLALRVGFSLRSDSFRYVSTPAWLGTPLEELDGEASLIWLASEYLRAFGPASIADFAWWTGVTKGRAGKAIGGVDTVDVGNGLLLPAADVELWESTRPLAGDEIALLPKWDAYTMGYQAAGQARFLREGHKELAYPKIRATRGDGAPLVLRGGVAVAAWGHVFQGDRMTITISPFDPADRLDWLEISAFDPVGKLLGASDITLTHDV